MPLDPSILAQGKPFQTPDPLQNYAKVLQIQNAQNQNALAQYQLGTAKRGEEGQNALSRAQQAAYDPETGTYDMNKLRGSMISGGFGALLPDFEKKMGEQQKSEGEIVVGRTKQFRDLLANVNSPSVAAQWLQAQYRDPVLGPVVSRMPLDQALAEIPTDPVKFNDWRNKNALGMEEFIKQNKPVTFETGTGQVNQRMSMPGLGGAATVVPGSTMQRVPTPGERMTDARMREKMAQDERQFEAQQANKGVAGAAPLKPLTEAQTIKLRTDVSKDYKAATTALSQMDDLLNSIQQVKTAPGLSAATGYTGKYLPSRSEGAAAQAETRLANLRGKVTALGKATAAMSGSIGSIANQEWKILADQIAVIDEVKGKGPLLEQIDLIEAQAKGAIERIRDVYEKTRGEDFERFPQFRDLPKSKAPGAPAAPAAGGGNWKDL